MGEPRRVDQEAVKRVLMEHEGVPGAFERAIGFRPATGGSYKPVHLMNDLVQSVLGGAPEHGGDFLARVVRVDVNGEDNSEATLRTDKRFGTAFDRAFPAGLGRERIDALRVAAREVLTFDGGVYAPGTAMCSPLATHRDLLGFEGFRRFGVGRFLAEILPEAGVGRLRAHMESEGDPITRAFRPLLLRAPPVDRQKKKGEAVARNAFDKSFGEALTVLMTQPLSKPAMLRTVAMGACLGLVLKILGAGREGGRPALLALAKGDERGPKPLRDEAVSSFRRGIDGLDRRVASVIPEHPNARDLLKKPGAKASCVEVPETTRIDRLATSVVSAARTWGGDDGIWWPDDFAVALGRKVGCVMPLSERAGWGKHLALTPEMIEILVLMHGPSGQRATTWSKFWARVREGLGIVVGANPMEDIAFLAHGDVESVSYEDLEENAETMLAQAVRRGVARRLPDGEAEVGGELK